MDVRFEPLPIWPHDPTLSRRPRSVFRAGWDNTRKLLVSEIDQQRGRDVVIGAGFEPRDLRRDGLPRADARAPRHPGVEVSFTTDAGVVTFHTDAHEDWQHNVRAIALSMEALRAVDRWGATQGKQWSAFRALPASTEAPSVAKGEQIVQRFMNEAGGQRSTAIGLAMRAHHPDVGDGNVIAFESVVMYRDRVER